MKYHRFLWETCASQYLLQGMKRVIVLDLKRQIIHLGDFKKRQLGGNCTAANTPSCGVTAKSCCHSKQNSTVVFQDSQGFILL